MSQPKKLKDLPEHPFPFVGTSDFIEQTTNYLIPLELFLRHKGYKVKIENRNYSISIVPPEDVLKLRITTFRGREAGAKHFYGTLLIPQIELIDLKTGYIRVVTSGDGKMSFFTSNQFSFPRKMELTRLLDARSALTYSSSILLEGAVVQGFNTAEEIEPHARETVARYFPGFKLIT